MKVIDRFKLKHTFINILDTTKDRISELKDNWQLIIFAMIVVRKPWNVFFILLRENNLLPRLLYQMIIFKTGEIETFSDRQKHFATSKVLTRRNSKRCSLCKRWVIPGGTYAMEEWRVEKIVNIVMWLKLNKCYQITLFCGH